MNGTSRSSVLRALLLGLFVTAAVALLHRLGYDERLEDLSYDWRCRYLAHAPQYGGDASAPAATSQGGITLVDIDDGTLQRVGNFPWPRNRIAQILEELQSAGARAVALDIILPDPQEVQFERAGITDLYSGSQAPLLGQAPRPVHTDRILADALRRYSDNTYLAFHAETGAGDAPAADAPGQPKPSDGATEDAAPAAAVRAALAAAPSAALNDVAKATPPNSREAVRREYLHQRAMAALQRFARNGASAGLPRARAVYPPMVLFAQACGHIGFTNQQRDVDGVLRRIDPRLADGGRMYLQLAVAMALDEIDRDKSSHSDRSARPEDLPTDANSKLLVNWTAAMRDWPTAFVHVPAGRLLELADQREGIERNTQRRRQVLLQIDRRHGNSMQEIELASDETFQRLQQAVFERQWALLFDPAKAPPEPVELQRQLDAQMARLDELGEQLLSDIREMGWDAPPADPAASAPATSPAAGPASDSYGRQLAEYRQLFAELQRLREIDQANAELRLSIRRSAEALRPLVAGRLCLVGATATGLGDMVPTPMNPQTPGLMVHASVLNTILTASFIRCAGVGENVVLVLLCGTIVSLACAFRPARQAALLTLLTAVIFVAANAFLAFRIGNLWLAMVAPLAAIALSFAAVTSYRQLTEEKQKRFIRRLFSHAMSEAVVDRLVAEPELMRLGGERRTVSCLFSDLEGFTSLSKSLGEQATVTLLNRYFDRIGSVIHGHRGYVNKFLGDGIFAIFGAPVVLSEHAQSAVLAALDCVQAVAELNAELARENHPAAGRLRCRVGITTGCVVMGNCGSHERLDYTAIGDTVNLASRMEGANKYLGTQILCDQATYEQSAAAVLARPVGPVKVVGFDEPVQAWQPMARRPSETDLLAAIDRFSDAVTAFQHQQFARAEELFVSVLAYWKDDPLVLLFQRRCQAHQGPLADAPFDKTTHLTQK